MTSISYAGTAGGQPRLFIPTMNQVTDPAVQTALQGILQWANTLTAGGGGLSDWGCYPVSGYDAVTGNVEWSSPTFNNFDYVQGDNETIEFPDGTVTLVVVDLSVLYTTASDEVLTVTTAIPSLGNLANLIVGTGLQAYIGLNGVIDSNASPGFSTTIGLTISGGTITNVSGGQMSLFSYSETT